MNKTTVVLVAAMSVAFAGYAEAAKPKKRTRNANRIGPYASAIIEQTRYPNDQSLAEDDLVNIILDEEVPTQNLGVSTEDTDMGYQASFGYRFTRYIAAELSLVHYGSVESVATAEMDFDDGFEPVRLKYSFSTGGPLLSAIGILPVSDKFELYGRVGYLFASSKREFSARVSGQSSGGFAPKADSTDLVLGVGASYHFNQMYSARLEYQQLDEVGDPDQTGLEDLRVMGLGIIIRF